MKVTMSASRLKCSLWLASLLVTISSARLGQAQIQFSGGSFSTTNVCAFTMSPPAACKILTNGFPSQPSASNGVLRLTTANTDQHGSAWFKTQQKVSSGFTSSFQFRISSCDGCNFPADGLAFVIQGDPVGAAALGYVGNGQNIAYGNNNDTTTTGPGHAIQNSLAVELDTFQNSDYGDPNGNHIAVQSCGSSSEGPLSSNSAAHNFTCPDGKPANLAIASVSPKNLADDQIHTITINYTPPATQCAPNCNNLTVSLDSTQILQASVDLTTKLRLTNGTSAFVGFTAATGASVENNDVISWSFSPPLLSSGGSLTITQPLQPGTTSFNFASNLVHTVDYSVSGTNPTGVFMQSTIQTITDSGWGNQFDKLVLGTPFQGKKCIHQQVATSPVSVFACVVTIDLCSTSPSGPFAGSNCPQSATDLFIKLALDFVTDVKPIVGPGLIAGTDNALTCTPRYLSPNPLDCRGLHNIFTGIIGDPTVSGITRNFNSLFVPFKQ